MKLLLDTHAVIYVLAEREALSAKVTAILADRGAEVFVSAASIYEIELKRRRGKLPQAIPAEFVGGLAKAGYALMPISIENAHAAAALPDTHRDPWDRLLVAQALGDNMQVATKDRAFAEYGVSVIW